MRYVAERGYPVPTVLAAEGPDLVMPYVEGPTMFDELRRRPATLLAHARRLAKLQQQLAAIAAPDWLMAPGWTPDPAGDAVLHLDLHPMNVVLSPDGPVVIDWTNAAAGPAGGALVVPAGRIGAGEIGLEHADHPGVASRLVAPFHLHAGRLVLQHLVDAGLQVGNVLEVGRRRGRPSKQPEKRQEDQATGCQSCHQRLSHTATAPRLPHGPLPSCPFQRPILA